MQTKFIYALVLFALVSCNNQANQDSTKETTAKSTELEVREYFLTREKINALFIHADGLEATMYNSGASFSVSDRDNVAAFVSLIQAASPSSRTQNQVGHILFLSAGQKLALCNVYNNGSEVYMLYKDDATDEAYFNLLTGKAKELFTGVKVQPKAE